MIGENPVTATSAYGGCPYCGQSVQHFRRLCPRIKAIEYHPNGTVKRVELHSEAHHAD